MIFGPMRPGRMGQGVVDGDRRPARPGVRPRNGPPLAVSTMRATRSAPSPAAQALVDGAVLGVDGDDLGPGRGPGPLDDRAAGDERLLVGQGQAPARPRGRPG